MLAKQTISYFGHKGSTYTIKSTEGVLTINNISIPRVDNARFLRVHIDQFLTWKTHISSVSSKVAKNIGILSRLSYLLPDHIRTSLYYTMVHPYLSYCSRAGSR